MRSMARVIRTSIYRLAPFKPQADPLDRSSILQKIIDLRQICRDRILARWTAGNRRDAAAPVMWYRRRAGVAADCTRRGRVARARYIAGFSRPQTARLREFP
jgi:hypothetical protein